MLCLAGEDAVEVDHQDPPEEEHREHDPGITEEVIDGVVEEGTEDGSWDTADDHQPIETPATEARRRVGLQPKDGEGKEATEVVDDDREDRAKLDHHREGLQISRALHTEDTLGEDHVPCGGDGEELREPLDDGQDDAL